MEKGFCHLSMTRILIYINVNIVQEASSRKGCASRSPPAHKHKDSIPHPKWFLGIIDRLATVQYTV